MVSFSETTFIGSPDWMTSKSARRIIRALKSGGQPVRFVGGCVRDSLLGKVVRDIDVATPEKPENVIKILGEWGVSVNLTGLKYGTVTAETEGQQIDITTLRIDTRTDGRWAEVEFTEDWYADARRRDFTMNALYCDPDGRIHDVVGGVADIKAKRVRFIGDPLTRISEDYLRLLRFFRFIAWYNLGLPDRSAIEACGVAATYLSTISGERIWREFSRLLIAPDPVPVLILMGKYSIINELFPYADFTSLDNKLLESMVRAEKRHDAIPNAIRRLAAWLRPIVTNNRSQQIIEKISNRLALTKSERLQLEQLVFYKYELRKEFAVNQCRKVRYFLDDPFAFNELALFQAALEDENYKSWEVIMQLPHTDPLPVFPIRGEDILALGVKQGPRVGKLLAETEEWWLQRNFLDDRKSLLNYVKTLLRG